MPKKTDAMRRDPEYWRKRQEKRRAQYRDDESHRLALQSQARKSYRVRNGVTYSSPSGLEGQAADMAITANVVYPNKLEMPDHPVMTFDELAAILGRTSGLVRSWARDGRLPAPLIAATVMFSRDYEHKKSVHVPQKKMAYSVLEVQAIIRVLGAHFDECTYYRKDHEHVKRALHEAISNARRINGGFYA